jgi:hypothetical protein
MSGNHRPSSHPSNRRSLQTRRRYLWISLGILLLLTIASGIFVYLVSPLRDPSFQPNSANGGTLVPWLQSVRERDWIRGATGLAALLATNLALLALAVTPVLQDSSRHGFWYFTPSTRNKSSQGISGCPLLGSGIGVIRRAVASIYELSAGTVVS